MFIIANLDLIFNIVILKSGFVYSFLAAFLRMAMEPTYLKGKRLIRAIMLLALNSMYQPHYLFQRFINEF